MFYMKNFKPTGKLQEKYNEYSYTIHLDWSILIFHCIYAFSLSMYVIPTPFWPNLRIFREVFADVITLHFNYFNIYLLFKKKPFS